MMAHDWHPTDEQLFDLVEGSLARADRRRVREHVDACLQCAGLVQAATSTASASPDAAIEPLPIDRSVAMHQALDAEWDRRNLSRARNKGFSALPRWRRIANVGVAMAVVAGVVGITTFGGSGTESDTRSREAPASGDATSANSEQAAPESAGGASAPEPDATPASGAVSKGAGDTSARSNESGKKNTPIAPGETPDLDERLDSSGAAAGDSPTLMEGNSISTTKTCVLTLRGFPADSVLADVRGKVTHRPLDPFGAVVEVCATQTSK